MTGIHKVLALALLLPCAAAAAEPAALARARALYNSGSYDAAIDAAASARIDPKAEDAAALVLARAHLERFRSGGAVADLTAARTALGVVRMTALSARDQLDLLIGLGQTLYFGESYGSAADVFDTALGRATTLSVRDRAKLLDWWATALDRQAQARTADRRVPAFSRVVERMEEELQLDPGSVIANYWLVWPRAAPAILIEHGTRQLPAGFARRLDRTPQASVRNWIESLPMRSSPNVHVNGLRANRLRQRPPCGRSGRR
jgi:hypothetical protein